MLGGYDSGLACGRGRSQHPIEPVGCGFALSAIFARLKSTRLITDDNMGTEWR